MTLFFCVLVTCLNSLVFYSSYLLYRAHRKFQEETMAHSRDIRAHTSELQANTLTLLKSHEHMLEALKYQRPYSMRN